jgi:hypothetical protein
MGPQNGCCWPTRLRPRWVVAAYGVAKMTDPVIETSSAQAHGDQSMISTGDRPFDWVAALALVSGVAVIVPGMIALLASVLAVYFELIR